MNENIVLNLLIPKNYITTSPNDLRGHLIVIFSAPEQHQINSGVKLFKDIKNKIKLELVQTKHYDSGLVEVSYIVKYQ